MAFQWLQNELFYHQKLCVQILQFSSVWLLSRVWLFGTPWTSASQASLSFTNSCSLLKFLTIESVMGMSLSILQELVIGREAWRAAIHGAAKSRIRLSDWTELNWNLENNIQKNKPYLKFCGNRSDNISHSYCSFELDSWRRRFSNMSVPFYRQL